mgnify:CR=1 FL=1
MIASIAKSLRAAGPARQLSASKRAAVAVVLRPLPDGTTAVLYILRRASERDPWSGQVGLPGGRRQASDRDDLETAVRECREEVGLQLDTESYELLGQLPDRHITARGGRIPDSALAAFVFAQRPGAVNEPLALQTSEIAAARWAHESCLTASNINYDITKEYSPLPAAAAALAPPALLRSLGLDRVSFPAVQLRESAAPTEEMPLFNLWGITLGITSDLLRNAGRPVLDSPPVRPHNALLRLAVRSLL